MKAALNQGNPVIKSSWKSPVIADPTFLPPGESPDQKWHLYAHSIWGIGHYVSADGLRWEKRETVIRWGMRPFIYRHEGRYYLYYEKYRPFNLFFVWTSSFRWKSSIYMTESADLTNWSLPTEVLPARLDWHADAKFGAAAGNPCIASFKDHFKLYYSAGFSYIPDCGFCEPKHIGYAESKHPRGPFTMQEKPLFGPDETNEWRNLAAGSIKVLKVGEQYFGFQNGIYWNAEQKRSGSAILALVSSDGMNWQPLERDPIIRPMAGTWMQSHVYACDVKPKSREELTIYFNARDEWHWTKGREAIGCGVISLR